MSIELSLETSRAVAGVDQEALIASVRAEIEKLERHARSSNETVEVTEKRVPPPPGAQGVDMLVQWLVELAQNPAMAKVYAKILVFSINEILLLAKRAAGKTAGDDAPGVGARLKVLGKDVMLPTSEAAIGEFLKDLDAGA